MLRVLRMGLVMLALLGLALAGPVQAACAMPEPAMATPCSGMMADDGEPAQQPAPVAPAKACTILQCPAAPPAVAQAAQGVGEPVAHAAQRVLPPARTMTSHDPGPEQRPPIA